MPETTHGADADSLHMRTHAPPGYACPLCRVAAGAERDAVVHEDEHLLVALSLHQKERNPGSLLVFPRAHVENIHTTPPALLAALHTTARTMARALTQALSADGVTIVQNNEPAGGQDVWHVHVHVVPRHAGDAFHTMPGTVMPMPQRASLAERIRRALV